MDIDIQKLSDIENIIEELEAVNERVIKDKTNFDNAMTNLKKLGFDTEQKAIDFLAKYDKQIKNRTIKLENSMNKIKEIGRASCRERV